MPSDIEIVRKWRESPLHYIKDIWNLVPQPFKKGVDPNLPSMEYKKEDFEIFIKGKMITWQQFLFFREIESSIKKKENVFLSIASGHGVGKSADLAIFVLWLLSTYIDTQIGATAPTANQLFDVLMKEISAWHRKMPKGFSDLFEIQSSYVRVKERPETWWMRASTARKESPEAFAGLHADTIALIADEASGVAEEIYEVGQGSLTGKRVFFIMMGNPTRLSGFFYDSHHKNTLNFRRLQFSSEDSPIVDTDFCNRIAEQYGKESPQYKVRVQGIFPEAEEDQLISRSLFDSATLRAAVRNLNNIRCLGIDPARYGGDRTAFVERQGSYIGVVKVRKDQDIVATANDAMAILRKAREEGNGYDFVMVDVIGLGAGLFDILVDKQRDGDISDLTKIIPVNVSETAEEEAEHHNKRVELWHRLREYLATGYIDPQLRDDCCSIKFTKPDNRGRNMLELKEHTRERTGLSPDLGDAACLCFAIRNQVRKKESNRFQEARQGGIVAGSLG